MKKALFRFACLFAILFATTLIFINNDSDVKTLAATIQENKNKISNLENNLGSKKNDIAYLDSQINEAKKNVQAQAGVKKLLDDQIASIQDEIDITKTLIDEYKIQIDAKKDEINIVDSNINDAVNLIRERLIIQHETGNSSMISFILSSDNLAEMLTRIEIANELFEYDQLIVENLNRDREILKSSQDELEALLQKCVDTETALSETEATLEVKVSDATAYLNQLKKDESYYQSLKAAKEKELLEIQNEIKALQDDIRRQQIEDYSNDEFRFPLPYDAYYRNTGGFGWRTWTNGRQTDYHRGVDFAAYYGTDIIACNSGVVIRSDYSNSFGNVVIIDHGGGICSLYAHASSRLVSKNDIVKKGDVIAKVGSTGDSTGNHLHFAILKDGEYVNPMNYISEP